ncbi:phosphatidylinositol N-acetylglucosaminyltransferase subunit C-like [Gigantopelta aegis]|uniref:phosphatidylinositol N-acetylglucosaminyltransferase subunit C-like n=1 Tax=Gigantopelta aegis TaxID=1735272 RepID=UPI001B8882ED|nr:phosphatidylinositol N-acetylglucosaminyltransferase subunit C-like [Gigantopelta aegis]
MAAPTKRKKWGKILYEDQGVPDNYVDASFLDELKRNLWTRSYDYWPVVYESGVVTQQLSSVCLFGVTFVYMNEKKLSAQLLFMVSSIFTLIGYVLNDVVDGGESRQLSKRTRIDDLKTAILFTGFSFGLSPLLVSLTETISTDTIYAMTTVMLLANLLFHDYGASAAMVSGALSLNAATFASVCLASRLNTTWHAFATVTFSFELFALWPVLRHKLKTHYPRSQPLMTGIVGLAGVIALLTVSTSGAVMFSILNLFITFICPYWLTRLQLYKNNIHGPWDEAVPVKD